MSGNSNQHYLNKADISVANLISEGGYLVAQQAKEFMEILIEESALLSQVTTVPMTSHTWELNKMGFTSRVLRPATEGTALNPTERVKPELGKVQITTQEYIAEARIPYSVVEDNVINGSFNDYMLRLLGKAVSRDMEEALILGDTTSADPFLAKQDGILKRATSLVVAGGSARLSKSVLKQMVQTMPSRFLRSQKNLEFITSKNAAIDYADSLASRATALGDAKLIGASAGEYMGYSIEPVPLWPENLGGSTNETTVLFCDPKNIHVGIVRDVRIETMRDITSREFVVVGTVRFGMNFQHEPAVVKATAILASAGA
jgi:HK97 family phage major capsid protein